ncbi:MAG: CBO0543 family protein [Sporomusaceae bacterium]|nr:CBO0543 family protein [Sporomusaceae bacterium]
MPGAPSDAQIAEMTRQLSQARTENWYATDLYTWQWFFLIALFILPWVAFHCLAHRRKLPRLILFGLILMFVTMGLDLLGYELGRWYYPYKIAPFGPFVAFVDHAPFPVIFMLLYQYLSGWGVFAAGVVVTAAVFAFVFEPALELMGLYMPLEWEFYYSFPVYILLPLFARWLTESIFTAAERDKVGRD